MMVLPLPLKNREVLKVDKANARDEVYRQLAEVYDPELDQPLTELGFIGDVRIAGDKVTVRFRLPTYWCAANFAYMMASDIRERVSELAWVKRVDVMLQDHFHDEEINEGIKHGKTFQTAFPDATDGLDDLRETFRVKAFQARQERVLRWLIRKGGGSDPEDASRGFAAVTEETPGSKKVGGTIFEHSAGTWIAG